MEETSECTDVSINPFEAESTDSLHLSKFSPSIFKVKTPSSTKKSPKFRWSIDQLAILKPADIDETPQQDTELDQDTEQRIQQAIDEFFSQKHVAPSPWSSGKPTKHVTFSPHPPRTNYYDVRSADNSGASSCDTSFTNDKANMVDACSQTSLTLPLDFDLQALLSSYYSYHQSSANEILSSSSLRRKLFLPAGSTTTESDSSPSINFIQSSRCGSAVFHENSLSLSPINSIKQRNIIPGRETPNTPASVKSQFSSSPKSTPSFTPISKKCASIVSSDIESPPISPIQMDDQENHSDKHRGWMYPMENTPCSKTKCMLYLSAPEISPIPCVSGSGSSMKSNSKSKGKENKLGSAQTMLNLKGVKMFNQPRGAVAKLNLMTVLDKPRGTPLKPVTQQHPKAANCHNSKEEFYRDQDVPISEPIPKHVPIEVNENAEDATELDELGNHLNHNEMQVVSCSSCCLEDTDANQRKTSQVDASMLNYDESPDTFDIEDDYLTSTMRRDYFSEALKENKNFTNFPDNDPGCSLIAKVTADDISCCHENMDISQESLLLPDSQNLVSDKIQSLPSITNQDQSCPVDPHIVEVINSEEFQDNSMMGSGRCDLDMSTMDSNCSIGDAIVATKFMS